MAVVRRRNPVETLEKWSLVPDQVNKVKDRDTRNPAWYADSQAQKGGRRETRGLNEYNPI